VMAVGMDSLSISRGGAWDWLPLGYANFGEVMDLPLLQPYFQIGSWNMDQRISGVVLLFVPFLTWAVAHALAWYPTDPIAKRTWWWVILSLLGIFVHNTSVIGGALFLIPPAILMMKAGYIMMMTEVHYEIACAWENKFDHFVCRAATITHIILAVAIFILDIVGSEPGEGSIDKGLHLTTGVGTPFLVHMIYHLLYNQNLVLVGRFMAAAFALNLFLMARFIPDLGLTSGFANFYDHELLLTHLQAVSLIGPSTLMLCFAAVNATLWLRVDLDSWNRMEQSEALQEHVEADNWRFFVSVFR